MLGSSFRPGARICCQTHGFLFDFDGTLVDLQPRPELVQVPTGLTGDLGRLQFLAEGAVAVVTGRELAFIDAQFNPLRLAGAGIHGLEMRLEPGTAITRLAESRQLHGIRAKAEEWARENPAIHLEDKGLSLALHYRSAPAMKPAVLAFARHLAGTGVPLLVVQQGHMVAEIRLAGPDKGSAVERLMQTAAFAGRTPVFFGDDITDEAAFAAVQARGGLAFFIGGEPASTIATGRIESPAAVRRLIAELVRREADPVPEAGPALDGARLP